MNSYSYRPRGVCSSQIRFDLEDGKLYNIAFRGGCDGNLKAIGKLLEGADAEFAIRTLKGNDCAGRGTSCADQLTKAIEAALQQEAQI
jgi:uncharacterized protein (TIGR03905 family)